MKLHEALQQPDKTRCDLEGVTITRADLKQSKTGNSYHSSTIVDGDTKAYISFFGDYPGILNEPVTITKAEISTYNGKRSFTAGKWSKVSKWNGQASAAPAPQPAPVSTPAPAKLSQDGPVMGMCFKLAADYLRSTNQEPTLPNLAKWTMFYKKAYSDVLLFNGPSEAPATEDAPF